MRLTAVSIIAASWMAALLPASAQDAPMPWMLAPDMAYAYGPDGQLLAYKLGTSNAKELLRGAKRVPRGTLFFVGANGQLFMRSRPYLESDGRFLFRPN